ncbi:LPXTG-motif cell wall anchor domain-containing protein [Micromonospora pattaloongensis]|uniref:LPXTG-motif cell wall anchor domain-containing protein n=1 Tax=Micromonospora pattaloongensis TaxID=405436 RepID=A0A1H3JZ42_9ACTN|nr:LPXTG cell wall anchor domain-containing protein [Micromonospora pattaloongensis]SDY45213.1 LPXTG-motif cell wall anchor domain-containing protein [Micromonospora pattaloongensis]
MRQHRLSMPALISAAGVTAALALATPAWAATTVPAHRYGVTAATPGNPPGANGTVKIDGFPYDDANNNEPHVTCEFRVEFFNFDAGERADLILEAQPPSGDFVEVARLNDQLVSDDDATGGSVRRDPDAYFQFSANDLDLGKATPHPKQGYHLRLTVDRKNHPEWTEKHKVFWLQPCAGGAEDSTDEPGATAPPSGDGQVGGDAGAENGGEGGGNAGGEGADDGELPITGAAVGGFIALGAALVAGGGALMFVRRRRSVTFTS